MYQTIGFKMTGSERRAARRAGAIDSLTRAEATKAAHNAETFDECKAIFDEHPSNRVKRSAFVRALTLAQGHSLAMPVIVTDFDRLVERFRLEGKPNPEKSARASMAAKAQARKRAEAATV